MMPVRCRARRNVPTRGDTGPARGRNILSRIDSFTGPDPTDPDHPGWHDQTGFDDPANSGGGFLRAEIDARDLPIAESGPVWTDREADDNARRFLDALAAGRPTEPADDAVEFARVNCLTILFGSEEHQAFDTYLARMPADLADRWADLLSGGARSEAFGSLTLREKLDESQVEEAIRSGRRQRFVNITLALLVLAGAAAGGVVGWSSLSSRGRRTQGTLRFATVGTTPSDGPVAGGVPAAEPALTIGLARAVAVARGDGPPENRIVKAPFADYLYPPGAITASLFSYGGVGEVVFVGPSGFPKDVCLIASVDTSDLRPLDTVWYGNCLEPIGRPATVRCLGDDALVLDVDIPEGAVELPEGGTGFADTIRVQSVSDPGTKYEVLSARGTISVSSDSNVVIPAFGGAAGDRLVFDLAEGRLGQCILSSAPRPD